MFGVYDSQGSEETLVRRGRITNYHLIAYSFQQCLCQKIPKSVDGHSSYSAQRQCRFLDTVYTYFDNKVLQKSYISYKNLTKILH